MYAVELTFSLHTGEGMPSAEGLEQLIMRAPAAASGRIRHARAHYFSGHAGVVAFVVAASLPEAVLVARQAAARAVAGSAHLTLRDCRPWDGGALDRSVTRKEIGT